MPTANLKLTNIKKQAQNLARIQNIQLCEAYEIISWAFYHCPNYQDLLKRVDDSDKKSHWFELAKIDSQSNVNKIDKLKRVLPILVDRLSKRMLCNTNRLGLTEQIYQIFGLPVQNDCFNSLFFNTTTNSEWKVVKIDGCSPYTLLESKITINKICYRVLAYNVFMPSHWPLKEQKYFDIAEEIAPSLAEEFQLNASEPEALQEAVFNYIKARLNDPEDDFVEFQSPFFQHSTQSKSLEEDIQTLLTIDGVGDWGNQDDQPIPFSFRGGEMLSNTYLIFGYPISEDENESENSWLIDSGKCPFNGSQVFLLNGAPVALEWISVEPDTLEHNYEYVEHFELIYALCSKQDNFSPLLERQGNLNQLLFIKPASPTQIRRDLELKPYVENGLETWLVKVENSLLAEEVIKRVNERDLYLHENKYGTKEIICKITGTWEEVPSLSISLEVLSSESERFMHLTTRLSSRSRDENCILFISISNSFINTLNVIPCEKLIKSMKNGLVQQVEEGTFSHLEDNILDIMDSFPPLPIEESKMLNSFELPDDLLINPLRLAQYSRQTQYERKSY